MDKNKYYDEIKQLLNKDLDLNNNINNPWLAFFKDDQFNLQICNNIVNSIKYVKEKDEAFFNKILKRINSSDYCEISSALSEIRVFYFLHKINFNVETKTNENGAKPEYYLDKYYIVEVNAPNYRKEELVLLNDFKSKTNSQCITEHSTTPFGKKDKFTEITASNVISKIASIKGKEHQFSDNKKNILWLDFQHPIWWCINNPEISLPFISKQGGIYSGEFWYSFFGWKGALIYEGKVATVMEHPGRFNQNNTKIDMVIISLPSKNILFQNPNGKKIENSFFDKILGLSFLSLEYSWVNYPSEDLKERLLLIYDQIMSFNRDLFYIPNSIEKDIKDYNI